MDVWPPNDISTKTVEQLWFPDDVLCSAQLCLTLRNPMDSGLPGCQWNFPGKIAGAGCRLVFQGIFLTRGANLCLLCLLRWREDSPPLCCLGSHSGWWCHLKASLFLKVVYSKQDSWHFIDHFGFLWTHNINQLYAKDNLFLKFFKNFAQI